MPILFNEQAKEEWRPAFGYEMVYEVSSYGRIKRLASNQFGRHGSYRLKEMILKPKLDKHGYEVIGLTKNKKQKVVKVHRIVCASFNENPENKPDVNHKNGIKTDNRVENLEWATKMENTRHAVSNGLRIALKGSEKSQAKLNEKDVFEIRKNEDKLTHKKLSEKYMVSTAVITRIINNQIWKHVKI